MGLSHNYLLYFEREHLWDVLQAVAAIADPAGPTTIHFPDHDLVLPIATGFGQAIHRGLVARQEMPAPAGQRRRRSGHPIVATLHDDAATAH